MSTRIRQIGRIGRTGVVAVVVLVVGLSFCAVIVQKACLGDVPVSMLELCATQWRTADRSSSNTCGRITGDSQPVERQYALLTLPLIIKTDNSENRYKVQTGSGGDIHNDLVYKGSQRPVLTSTCLISSRLGRQLTLVGAKPSGTS
jgi:hypothetical protein